jgi:hypothetical protein
MCWVRKSCKKGRAMSYPVQLDQILWSSGPGTYGRLPRRSEALPVLRTRRDRPQKSCVHDGDPARSAARAGTPMHARMARGGGGGANEPSKKQTLPPAGARALEASARRPRRHACAIVRGQETRTRGMGLVTTCGAFVWSRQGTCRRGAGRGPATESEMTWVLAAAYCYLANNWRVQ